MASQLIKRLTGLFKKKQPKIKDFQYLVETIFDEVTESEIVVHFVCACDERVIRIDDGVHFYCPHCDRTCYAGNCQKCKRLFDSE